MKRIVKPLLFAMLAFLVVQCSPWEDFFNCVDGNGVEASEIRAVPEFSGVRNASAFDVEIIYDTDYQVEVFADQNLLPYINIYVSDGQLFVETEYSRCLNSNHPIKVEVRMPTIDRVDLSGSGDIIVSDFKVEDIKFKNAGSGDITAWNFECTSLDVANSGSGEINVTDIFCSGNANVTLIGSGDIILAGMAEKAIYLVTGSGHLRAADFPVEECSVSNSGSGNVFCYVNQKLNIMLTGSGNITYYGTPTITQLVTGSGYVYSGH